MKKLYFRWFKLSLFLIGLSLLGACDDFISKSDSDIVEISYGSSFGECLGYCSSSIRLDEENLSLKKTGWDREGVLPDIDKSMQIEQDVWGTIIQHVDFERFLALDSIIGCPDCADGGAEWIEMKTASTKHKVVFEYGNEPEQLKKYVHYLRTYQFAIANNRSFKEDIVLDESYEVVVKLCSRGCYQYLLRAVNSNAETLLFPEWLGSEFRKDGTKISLNGVLTGDSTNINKPAPNDVPIFDFKAPNIRLFQVLKIDEE